MMIAAITITSVTAVLTASCFGHVSSYDLPSYHSASLWLNVVGDHQWSTITTLTGHVYSVSPDSQYAGLQCSTASVRFGVAAGQGHADKSHKWKGKAFPGI